MPEEYKPTTPKPFVFVLMPFAKEFDDIYKFGIKGAADDAGAYAERLDEQMFDEGMLERIFNQISKADVLVADMTARNPNVFYEVGYAHALGKVVLLLTHNADDIPFDLKHRPHIVYAGSIESLRGQLAEKLVWAIDESKKRSGTLLQDQFVITLGGVPVPQNSSLENAPTIEFPAPADFRLALAVRNVSPRESQLVEYIYVFAAPDSALVPSPFEGRGKAAELVDRDPPRCSDGLSWQYRLKGTTIPNLPPQAIERCDIGFEFAGKATVADSVFRLRLHTYTGYWDFPFRLKVERPEENK